MKYDFSRRERSFRKIVFALTLDRKKKTERIVIGEINETRRHLTSGDGKIICEYTRPLGELMLTFEADPDREWEMNILPLRESYKKIFPFELKRWEIAAPVSSFLSGKYACGEPFAVFAAVRTWEEYLNCYYVNHGADTLSQRLYLIYRPFFRYGKYKPWQEEASDELLHDGEAAVELWYPISKRPFECVVACESLQPIIAYYMYKIAEWRYVFQECKVCGKYFLARSRHYELCSDECRKIQAIQAKREYDGRMSGNHLESIHEAAYFYWYNRLRKLKRTKNPDIEAIARVSAAFDVFKKETVRLKKMVKSGKMSASEFSSWLLEQESVVDGLIN
jgi:hypothetical protein